MDCAPRDVTPFVECVEATNPGFVAHFGYRSGERSPVTIGIGPANMFAPGARTPRAADHVRTGHTQRRPRVTVFRLARVAALGQLRDGLGGLATLRRLDPDRQGARPDHRPRPLRPPAGRRTPQDRGRQQRDDRNDERLRRPAHGRRAGGRRRDEPQQLHDDHHLSRQRWQRRDRSAGPGHEPRRERQQRPGAWLRDLQQPRHDASRPQSGRPAGRQVGKPTVASGRRQGHVDCHGYERWARRSHGRRHRGLAARRRLARRWHSCGASERDVRRRPLHDDLARCRRVGDGPLRYDGHSRRPQDEHGHGQSQGDGREPRRQRRVGGRGRDGRSGGGCPPHPRMCRPALRWQLPGAFRIPERGQRDGRRTGGRPELLHAVAGEPRPAGALPARTRPRRFPGRLRPHAGVDAHRPHVDGEHELEALRADDGGAADRQDPATG